MDCNTGKLYQSLQEALDDEANISNLVPITKREHKFLHKRSIDNRKNWMRNKPCVCGSGKKFKKCCWNKFSPSSIMEQE